ncbi:hypothetical protein P691DRAFT_762386 [Macrolepiota fuliginosa MF-IS2]|uniref:Uncharacterized protein n=1 Tax=Macrolepiota fuliginosa MF-IS2 TaxID=1400762 RepID=A0A9P5X6R2_9AGAR|nr:hypothetical protein P691DRAFT_762386 [Macrolepiota fuliginosa MF-IS2]
MSVVIYLLANNIELYLHDSFENILRHHNIPTKSQWPSDHDIQILVKASNGLFIYATTALRIVARAGSLEEVLHAVCATTFDDECNSPIAELDAIYVLIMWHIPPIVLPNVLLLCFILCTTYSYASFREPRPYAMLYSNILTLSEIEFWVVCNHLSAVLHVYNHSNSLDSTQLGDTSHPLATIEKWMVCVLGGSLQFYHKSFCDFITDPTRSGTFCATSPPTVNAYYKCSLEIVLKCEESYSLQGSGEVYPSFQFLAYILNAMNQEPASAPDSACPLSWPHVNELANFALETQVHCWVFSNCFDAGGWDMIEHYFLQCFARVNFRKSLQNPGTLYAGNSDLNWGCNGYLKIIHGTRLFRVPQDEFQTKFNVAKFKVVIKRWKECGIVQPYYPNLTSRFKSLISKKSQGNFISGLYRMGHGTKSIFWYWEINLKGGYYQEFQAADLDEGDRVYRDERFDLWPTTPLQPDWAQLVGTGTE